MFKNEYNINTVFNLQNLKIKEGKLKMKKKMLINYRTLLAIGAVVFILCLMLLNAKTTQNRFVEKYSSKIDEIEMKLNGYDDILQQNIILIEENTKLTRELDEIKLMVKNLENPEMDIILNNDIVPEVQDIVIENESITDETVEIQEIEENITLVEVTEEPVDTEIVEIDEEISLANKVVLDKINFTDITRKSGMTAEAFDLIIETAMKEKNKPNSKLIGMGKYFVEMEEKWNVNGFFALGVSSFESGWGERYEQGSHNLFGYRSGKMKMDNYGDSIVYFGKLMTNENGYYFAKGKTTVASISKVYCPPEYSKWTNNVNWMMGYYRGLTEKLLL